MLTTRGYIGAARRATRLAWRRRAREWFGGTTAGSRTGAWRSRASAECDRNAPRFGRTPAVRQPSELDARRYLVALVALVAWLGTLLEERTLPALQHLCAAAAVPEDAAGATVLALATGGFEVLFSTVETVEGRVGVGLNFVLGSGVVNFGLLPCVVAASAACSRGAHALPLDLDRVPVVRDGCFALAAFAALLWVVNDGVVTLGESFGLLFLWVAHVVCCFRGPRPPTRSPSDGELASPKSGARSAPVRSPEWVRGDAAVVDCLWTKRSRRGLSVDQTAHLVATLNGSQACGLICYAQVAAAEPRAPPAGVAAVLRRRGREALAMARPRARRRAPVPAAAGPDIRRGPGPAGGPAGHGADAPGFGSVVGGLVVTFDAARGSAGARGAHTSQLCGRHLPPGGVRAAERTSCPFVTSTRGRRRQASRVGPIRGRVTAPPRVPRGYSAGPCSVSNAASRTWIVRGQIRGESGDAVDDAGTRSPTCSCRRASPPRAAGERPSRRCWACRS